jgi:hypothetical protein
MSWAYSLLCRGPTVSQYTFDYFIFNGNDNKSAALISNIKFQYGLRILFYIFNVVANVYSGDSVPGKI